MASAGDASAFECLRCGTCCRITGFVRVSPEEVAEIARYLELSVAEVREQYMAPTVGDIEGEILLDHPGTTHCIFLEGQNHCQIHPVKPQQCRTFPIEWTRADANLYCPGLRGRRGEEK